MNTVLFEPRSTPHSCSHQADRFSVCVREQEHFILCFRKSRIWPRLTASTPVPCSSHCPLSPGYFSSLWTGPLLPSLPPWATLNITTRVISLKHKPDHVTPLLKFLHWLPVSLKNESQSPYKAFKALPWPTPNYLLLPPTPPSLHMLLQSHWFPCYSWNRHQAPSSRRSLALAVLSTWNSLPLVANTASSPSLNLYSNLAFWTKLPLTTLFNAAPSRRHTHTLQHFQSSSSTISFFSQHVSPSDIISLFIMLVNYYLSPPLECKFHKDWHLYMFCSLMHSEELTNAFRTVPI